VFFFISQNTCVEKVTEEKQEKIPETGLEDETPVLRRVIITYVSTVCFSQTLKFALDVTP
jgi:hypothetical protein